MSNKSKAKVENRVDILKQNVANISKKKDKKTKTEKRKIGDLGENIACTFLMKHGFGVVEKNYLKKYGELDIIALKEDIYHFIEVKTVSCENFPDVNHETDEYRPEDNIHTWKLKRLSRTIQAYILERKIYNSDWQFDIALVYLHTRKRLARVNLLEDIIL